MRVNVSAHALLTQQQQAHIKQRLHTRYPFCCFALQMISVQFLCFFRVTIFVKQGTGSESKNA